MIFLPRPRRFVESHTPAEVCRLYIEGRSTRELEAQMKLSRWVISRWVLENGGALRDRDDALERQRYFRSIEQERADAARCVWPDCRLVSDDGHLCAPHWLELYEQDAGPGCGWPRCQQSHVSGQPACDYHLRKAQGVIS